MNSKQKVLYISQEVTPYLPETHLGHLCQYIPHRVQEEGFEVRTFMPKYGCINERRNQLHEVIRLSGMNIIIDDNDHPLIIKVASLQPSRIQVYFIDNDDYFQKLDEDCDVAGSNRADNDERALFFARGTMETAKKLRWDPKVILCSGWITALTPLFIKRMYGDDLSFKNSKVVYMVMPGQLEAPVDERIFTKLKADGFATRDLKKFAGLPFDVNLLHRMAIDFSHAVIFNDPDVSPELLEYVKESGKPYITADKLEGGIDAYADFIKSL